MWYILTCIMARLNIVVFIFILMMLFYNKFLLQLLDGVVISSVINVSIFD